MCTHRDAVCDMFISLWLTTLERTAYGGSRSSGYMLGMVLVALPGVMIKLGSGGPRL